MVSWGYIATSTSRRSNEIGGSITMTVCYIDFPFTEMVPTRRRYIPVCPCIDRFAPSPSRVHGSPPASSSFRAPHICKPFILSWLALSRKDPRSKGGNWRWIFCTGVWEKSQRENKCEFAC